ncbi:MAG: dienelactone hydrolase family protein [Acidobacteria bacterium]|nr:dienelactone hydrolase family protein [Acidobacteriota bacterium]
MRELPLPSAHTSASLHGAGRTVVVLGHGAGGNRRTPMLLELAEALAASGRAALLYNFPYAERGARRPDPPRVLEATAREAAELAVARTGATSVVWGGRSMGGRIASQVVAGGAPCAALAFLAYPLHPPGRPEKRREAHLPDIAAPMLFLQGTRDAFAREDLLHALVHRLGDRAVLHPVEGADHSFRVLKRSGRTPEDVQEEVRAALLDFLEQNDL